MGTQELELTALPPPAALLERCADQPYAFALDGGDQQSWGCGHALLGFAPRATLQVSPDGSAVVHRDSAATRWHGDPFALLERFHAECSAGTDAQASLAGGVVVALSYELRHWVERLGAPRPDEHRLPVLHAAFYDWLLSYSYRDRCYRLLGSAHEVPQLGDRVGALASAALVDRRACDPGDVATPDSTAEMTREQYDAAVHAVLDYIAAGDVYQVNLAQRFVVAQRLPGAALFSALQRQHRVPFAAYVDAGSFALVSNSPECFLTRRGAQVATFPVKGTRPRGADPDSDRRLAFELATDPKERAEHLMIVDLERNDLGRVCRTGSVRVPAFARVRAFPTLHHLVSEICGELRPGMGLSDLLRAAFPCGSITGAPKIRAMQIIDEIEPASRGFYTGAIGFIGLDGTAVFNVAIRTAVAAHGRLAYHAGGGIVADSTAAREYAETLLKAQPFFTALAGHP